ncbi:MAG: tellurite resistance TerB family protein [Alphaproteobacteria bacterium]
MHVLLAILGAVVTILFYLNKLSRSGIDFGWLNPFAWKRRRNWNKKYAADPIYKISNPMEATALLMYTMARASGDISREQKVRMQNLFVSEFSLSDSRATELLSSCSFLMQNDEDKIIENLKKFLAPSANQFNAEQRESAYELILEILQCEEQRSEKQEAFLRELQKSLLPLDTGANKKWA